MKGGEWNLKRSCVSKTWFLLLTCIKRGGTRLRFIIIEIFGTKGRTYLHTPDHNAAKSHLFMSSFIIYFKYDYLRYVNIRNNSFFMYLSTLPLCMCTLCSLEYRKISRAIKMLIESILLSSHPTYKDWFESLIRHSSWLSFSYKPWLLYSPIWHHR